MLIPTLDVQVLKGFAQEFPPQTEIELVSGKWHWYFVRKDARMKDFNQL